MNGVIHMKSDTYFLKGRGDGLEAARSIAEPLSMSEDVVIPPHHPMFIPIQMHQDPDPKDV